MSHATLKQYGGLGTKLRVEKNDYSSIDLDSVTNKLVDKISDEIKDSLNCNVKVGRNDPCPCGSGKKYKNCCGKNA